MNISILDFHTHVKDETSVNEIIKLNDLANIRKSVICSGNMIDSGKIGNFLRGSLQIQTLIPNNDFILETALNNPCKFYPFFTVDPNYHTDIDIINALENGFCGLKLNPIIHHVDFNSSALIEIFESLNGKSIPVYTHITLAKESNLEALIQLAKSFGNIRFIIGHMGFSTSDFDAIDACENCENIYIESSIGSRLAFLEIKARGLIEKLLFGSEYPLHDPRVELYKLQIIFDDEELNKICHENAVNVLNKSLIGAAAYEY